METNEVSIGHGTQLNQNFAASACLVLVYDKFLVVYFHISNNALADFKPLWLAGKTSE
tara:strand:- start:530 stop:703 length:174 start_codon:yes stop_codon:yes gene_type:complete